MPNVSAVAATVEPIVVQIREPMVIVQFNDGCDDRRYGQYLADMTRILYSFRGQKRVVMNDATRWAHSSPVQRKMQADWLKEHADQMRLSTYGVGFVFSSALVRGGLTAVLWLSPLPVPHRIFRTLDEGLLWASDVVKRGTVEGT